MIVIPMTLHFIFLILVKISIADDAEIISRGIES